MNPLKFSLMMMKSSINYLYQSPWQALAKSFPQSELQHVARSTKYYCCTPVDTHTRVYSALHVFNHNTVVFD